MARLYWRVKKNNKWPWKPAEVSVMYEDGTQFVVVHPEEEEESPGCSDSGTLQILKEEEE